jgi:hypothetical protein
MERKIKTNQKGNEKMSKILGVIKNLISKIRGIFFKTTCQVGLENPYSYYMQDKEWNDRLMSSSLTPSVANTRKKVYEEVFKNLNDVNKEITGSLKVVLGNQLIKANLEAPVRSFAGFLSIERSMKQAVDSLMYGDIDRDANSCATLPNVNEVGLGGVHAKFKSSDSLYPTNSVITKKKLIPGYLEINIVRVSDPEHPIKIVDDRKGNLLSLPGVLRSNPEGETQVNYSLGEIIFTLCDEFKIERGDTYTIKGVEDCADSSDNTSFKVAENNHFRLNFKHVVVATELEMLIAESNLMCFASENSTRF